MEGGRFSRWHTERSDSSTKHKNGYDECGKTGQEQGWFTCTTSHVHCSVVCGIYV